ncbi:MAG: hypothetical protein U0984_15760, partial [Prosthecobacter sp.]|nr:hypothetical protein [Prosthecobacter sp.]
MSNRFTDPLRNIARRWLANPAAALVNRVSTSVVALTMGMHIGRANKWRDNFNPLRGLTMRKAVQYL